MTHRTSSADPVQLLRYVLKEQQWASELIAAVPVLDNRIQTFERSCTELNYRMNLTGCGNALRTISQDHADLNTWVQGIADAFARADQIQMRIPLLVKDCRNRWGQKLVTWFSVPLFSQILSAPPWLFSQVQRVTWFTHLGRPDISDPQEESNLVDTTKLGQLLEEETVAESDSKQPHMERDLTGEKEASPDGEKSSQPWWHDVASFSQRDLEYKGQSTEYGCTPTAASMILYYWHAKDPLKNKRMSSQQLLDINAEQGEFKITGMSASRLHDELQELGYQAEDHLDSNFETLQQEVAKGPVVALVRLNMKTAGEPHAVVVTGISKDGKEVRLNDPWTGQSHTYPRDEFMKSWRTLRNSFMTIQPLTE